MVNDPAYRFEVIYKDDRSMSQEDDNGVVVRDHCHVEDWDNVKIYALTNRPKDHTISVNFETGDFAINNTLIKVMLSDVDMYWRPFHDKAVFRPLYGRKRFVTESGEATFFYCGWETDLQVPVQSSNDAEQKFIKKKFRRIMYVSEYGVVFFES